MNRYGALGPLLMLLLIADPAAAQQPTFHGQIRPRYEYRDPAGEAADGFTSMRVRFGLQALVEPGLTVFMQVQDVRLWGEESSPLGDYSANALDLHQGYIRYNGEGMESLTTTIGRMETNLGGQRLVGAVDWTQQGQSFDGVRLDVAKSWGTLALLAYMIGDATDPEIPDDKELFGAYATVTDVGPGNLDVYWLYNRVEGAANSDEQSLGARYAWMGGLSGRVEGTVQNGTRGGVDVAAFMVGGRVGRRFADGKGTFTLWYDYLSGDDPATPASEVFNTLYATNHKFYGFADLFLNIPVHTGGSGLQDMAAKFLWRAGDHVSVGADVHSFHAAEQRSLTDTHFANEFDLTLTHRYSQNLGATVGFAKVFQDEALGQIGRLSKNMTWFYVMLDAHF